MPATIIGVFDDATEAQNAARDLQNAGFGQGAITIDRSQGSFNGSGIDEKDRSAYSESLRRGGCVVRVQASDQASARTAEQILDRDGALDVDQLREQFQSAAPNDTLKVIREKVQIGKQQVQRGGVRVRTYVTEEPVSQDIKLREEHVDVRRDRVDKAADPSDLDRLQDQTFEVRETAEVPVVKKEARVVEEVSLDKTATDRTETIKDKVRESHVDVEKLDKDDRSLQTDRADRVVTSDTSAAAYDDRPFRDDFERRYASTGATYEHYAPAYRYGYQLSTDPRYHGRPWSEVESEARQNWEQRNPNTWDRYSDAVRYSWDRGAEVTPGGGRAYADNPSQSATAGGTETPEEDQRGFFEKIADALTGDHTDDKTGKQVE